MRQDKLKEIIIPPNQSIRNAVETIQKSGTRGVFVCDEDNELLGIVMDSDIRRAILSQLDLNVGVRTIMKTSPYTIHESVSAEERKVLFMQSDKMLVPIVNAENQVVDYLALSDVLETLSQKLDPVKINFFEPVLPPKKILVIGGAGYIGSVLVEKLLKIGHQVRVLDFLIYSKDFIQYFPQDSNLEFIRGDCRDEKTMRRALEGVEAVVHLGEIVGDPACSINENFTIETNYLATHMIVELCVKLGVKRFVFASSCSVYGHNPEEVDETSELNPISLYARCKIESEKAILDPHLGSFCPTILRLATLHGVSHRQRFDLVANFMTVKALAEGKIHINGGEQWRPMISVKDVCQGIVAVLHSEGEKVQKQIFNLGDTRENYQITQIGRLIKQVLPEVEIEFLKGEKDKRDYKVSFEKMKNQLGYTAETLLIDSIKEMVQSFEERELFNQYQEPKFHNKLSLT